MDLFGLVFFVFPLGGMILAWLAYAFSGKAPKQVRNVGNGLLIAFMIAIVALYSHTSMIESNQKALFDAAVAGDTAGVERLIQSGADVNYWGEDLPATPLAGAARTGQTDTVKALLRLHADPNPGGQSPLLIAEEADHPDIVQLLMAARAKK